MQCQCGSSLRALRALQSTENCNMRLIQCGINLVISDMCANQTHMCCCLCSQPSHPFLNIAKQLWFCLGELTVEETVELSQKFRVTQNTLADNPEGYTITEELVRHAYSKTILNVLGKERLAAASTLHDETTAATAAAAKVEAEAEATSASCSTEQSAARAPAAAAAASSTTTAGARASGSSTVPVATPARKAATAAPTRKPAPAAVPTATAAMNGNAAGA
eukprot:21131-Heterococcus_DN1.PRE.5